MRPCARAAQHSACQPRSTMLRIRACAPRRVGHPDLFKGRLCHDSAAAGEPRERVGAAALLWRGDSDAALCACVATISSGPYPICKPRIARQVSQKVEPAYREDTAPWETPVPCGSYSHQRRLASGRGGAACRSVPPRLNHVQLMLSAAYV